jgi:hypothetical protein
MPEYRFSGKVLPLFKEFTMIGEVGCAWNDLIDPPNVLHMTASVSIKKGIVDVLCESNLSGSDEYDGQVQRRAIDLATSVVASYGFIKGMGLTVTFETVTKPDRILYNINPHYPRLEALVTAGRSQADGGVNVQPIMEIALSDGR